MKIERLILKYQSDGRRITRTLERGSFHEYHEFIRQWRLLMREIFNACSTDEIITEFVPIRKTVVTGRQEIPPPRERTRSRPFTPNADDVPRLPRAEKGRR